MPDTSNSFVSEVERRMYAHMVGRQMTCPITGAVLDVRTAVVVESADGERVLGIVSPEAWAKMKAGILEKMPNARVLINAELQPNEPATS